MHSDNDQSNFSAFLELLSNQYNGKLNDLKGAEDEAIQSFYNSYNEMLNKLGLVNYNDNNLTQSCDKSEEIEIKRHDQTKKSVNNNTANVKEDWANRVTIPEPFDLSCYQNKKSENVNVESVEHYSIRANPVPAHVHLPIFQMMKEHEPKEREERREQRKNKLLAAIKPFNLSNQKEIRFKSSSLSNLNTRSETNSKHFAAAPFPEHLFSNRNKPIAELNEEFRKIRIRARAEEMLKQSSLPFSGSRILKRWNSFTMDKPTKTKSEQLAKKAQTPLIIKPFLYLPKPKSVAKVEVNLGTNTFSSSHCKISEQSIPDHKPTKTSALRKERARQTIEKENVMEEIDPQEKSHLENIDVKKLVHSKVRINNHLLCSKESIKEKLRQNREADQRRQQEYSQELQEMNDRVKKRPLLIDRQSIESARKLVERKIKQGIVLPNRGNYEQRVKEQSETDSSNDNENSCRSSLSSSVQSISE